MGDKAAVIAGDDMGDGLQCTDHPYQISPGGICAFCLQDRLGKLVSSSNTDPVFPPTDAASDTIPKTGSTSDGGSRGRASRIPFLSAAAAIHRSRHHKKGGGGYSPYDRRAVAVAVASSSTTTTTTTSSSSSSNSSSGFALKRSKSVNPRPLGGVAETGSSSTDSPRKKSRFWSFLSAAGSKSKSRSTSSAAAGADLKSQASTSFGRKVSRSRSVGCGSRSFSGDFLERISTGFADCTLRRAESQREANCKAVVVDEERRVKCGGLFGMLSSSSSYWISAAAAAADHQEFDDKGVAVRGRSRSWGWGWAASSAKPPLVAGGAPTTVITGGASNSKIGPN